MTTLFVILCVLVLWMVVKAIHKYRVRKMAVKQTNITARQMNLLIQHDNENISRID